MDLKTIEETEKTGTNESVLDWLDLRGEKEDKNYKRYEEASIKYILKLQRHTPKYLWLF